MRSNEMKSERGRKWKGSGRAGRDGIRIGGERLGLENETNASC